MEDKDIVELYWARSQRAIEETDEKYGKYCHTIAYNICLNNEDAEECVSDTWFKAWNSMPSNRPERLIGFLGNMTRNLALDRWREKRRKKRGGGETELALSELSEYFSDSDDVEKEIEFKELESAIADFVRELPQRERRIFTARYYFMSPVGDIAKRLGERESRTKMTLYRLRTKLREKLEKEGLC